MDVQLKNKEGNSNKVVPISNKVFGGEVNKFTIYEAIKNQLANKRQGTASTKTRKEVIGTTKKPWRQKGTGRARAGSAKSPIWRGGGTIFGPHPRSYNYNISKKVRQNAFFSIMSLHQKEKNIEVLEDFVLPKHSTKQIVAIFTSLLKTYYQRVVFILNSDDKKNYDVIKKSCRNITWLRTMNSKSIELKDLYYANKVVLTETALKEINKCYSEANQ